MSIRIGYNLTAAAAGLALLPAVHAVLAVLGDRQPAARLGAGIVAMGLAALLDWRVRRWPSRVAVWAAILGVLTDQFVLAPVVQLLTGVTW
jgi:hypothetical protein